MGLTGALPQALAVLAVAAMLLGVAGLVLRWYRRRAPRPAEHLPAPVTLPAGAGDAGVVVAGHGGTVEYANERARALFGLNGDAPTLTRLLRNAQPADNLLGLFAAEGQTQVSVGDQPVAATSHRVALPGGGERFVLLLRPAVAPGPTSGAAGPDAEALRTLAEIGLALTASLDPAETYAALLDALPRAFRFSLAELNLWDPAAQVLRAARHTGDRDYVRDLGLVGNH